MFGNTFLENCANIRDRQIRVNGMVGDIPWRIGNGSEKFRLIALNDRYVGFGGAAPQLNFVCPNQFENRFINQYLIFQC
jgi:hypothetical protein